jgi:hypothetical protein
MKDFFNSQAGLIITIVSGAFGYCMRFIFENKNKKSYRRYEIFNDKKIDAIIEFHTSMFQLFQKILVIHTIRFAAQRKIAWKDVEIAYLNYQIKYTATLNFFEGNQYNRYATLNKNVDTAMGTLGGFVVENASVDFVASDVRPEVFEGAIVNQITAANNLYSEIAKENYNYFNK